MNASSTLSETRRALDRPELDAVLWDFGGVLTESPFEAFNRYEAAHGLPRDFLRGVNARDPDRNAWARFERSEIDLDAFDRAFRAESQTLGYEVPGRDVIALVEGALRPAMVEALRRCAARLTCVCLTNNVVPTAENGADGEAGEGTLRKAEVMALFDAVIESSKVGARKPDPRIYRIALDAAGAAPERTIYLDDLGINLKPARTMGMRTIKVGDADAAIAELEEAVGFALR